MVPTLQKTARRVIVLNIKRYGPHHSDARTRMQELTGMSMRNWIVMRAFVKQRERHFATVHLLIHQISRWHNDISLFGVCHCDIATAAMRFYKTDEPTLSCVHSNSY